MKTKSSMTLAVILFVAANVFGQNGNAKYPSMAPLEQYLTHVETSLARSAAPKSISDNADILILTRHGYETAVRGSNGFVCVVERSWSAD
jgi:hypothetical protein